MAQKTSFGLRMRLLSNRSVKIENKIEKIPSRVSQLLDYQGTKLDETGSHKFKMAVEIMK